jgi:hypothetical protein
MLLSASSNPFRANVRTLISYNSDRLRLTSINRITANDLFNANRMLITQKHETNMLQGLNSKVPKTSKGLLHRMSISPSVVRKRYSISKSEEAHKATESNDHLKQQDPVKESDNNSVNSTESFFLRQAQQKANVKSSLVRHICCHSFHCLLYGVERGDHSYRLGFKRSTKKPITISYYYS